MMLPTNTGFAELEHVFVFDAVHSAYNVMRDHGLKFAGKPLEHAHFNNGHESGLLQSPDVAGDRGEVVIETGKTMVGSEFSSKMVSSQVASYQGDLVRAAFVLQHGRSPLRLYRHKLTASPVIGGATRISPVPNIYSHCAGH